MQDEVNEKVVALSIKTSKLTAEVLQKAMKAVLAKGKQQLSKAPHGKITMRQLMKPGEKVTNIEITDANIKSFDPMTTNSLSQSRTALRSAGIECRQTSVSLSGTSKCRTFVSMIYGIRQLQICTNSQATFIP